MMTLKESIVRDSRGARRVRWLAPLIIVLVLAALVVVPGFLAEQAGEATLAATTPGPLGALAGFPLLVLAGLRRVG